MWTNPDKHGPYMDTINFEQQNSTESMELVEKGKVPSNKPPSFHIQFAESTNDGVDKVKSNAFCYTQQYKFASLPEA